MGVRERKTVGYESGMCGVMQRIFKVCELNVEVRYIVNIEHDCVCTDCLQHYVSLLSLILSCADLFSLS